VRRYHASDGKLVPVYGRVAGRACGHFKPLDFGDLSDIVADGKGGFYSGGVPSQSSSISKVIRRIAHGGIVDLVKLDCEGAEWEILQDSQAMKCVINLTMEYHLAGEESLDHLLDMQFQIDFVHRDEKKWTAPRLQRITTALTVCSSKSVGRADDQYSAECESPALFQP